MIFRVIFPCFKAMSSPKKLEELGRIATASNYEPHTDSVPMEVNDRHPSISESEIMNNFDYRLGGVDIRDQLPGTSATADSNDEAFQAFLRNEISYNQYSQLTGNPMEDTVETLVPDDSNVHDSADEDEEDDLDEDGLIDVVNHEDLYSLGRLVEDDDEDEMLDDEEEVQMHERPMKKRKTVVQSMPLVPSDLKSQLSINESGEFGIPKTVQAAREKEYRRPSRGVIKKLGGLTPLDALIGQANLMCAKGQTDEALEMFREVIRQNPRDPEAYLQVSQMYNGMEKPMEALQYGLVGAHLSSKTPADDWSYLGDLAVQLNRMEEAAACYFKAMKMDPSNWIYYEKRITVLDKLGLTSLSMKTRLMAASSIDHVVSNVNFRWFEDLIKSVADYYICTNNETKAIESLEAFVLRSKQFGFYAREQHELLLGMWMKAEKFDDAAKSIFALCDGIRPLDKEGKLLLEITWTNSTFKLKPWPNLNVASFQIAENVPTFQLTNLAVCLIRLGNHGAMNNFITTIFKGNPRISTNDEAAFLEVARAYITVEKHQTALLYLQILSQIGSFIDNPEMWHLKGLAHEHKRELDEAMSAFERVLSIQPEHVDARINLSNIQQSLGDVDKALETIRGHDLDLCTRLPDERLLIRQAEMLYNKKEFDQYVRCVRMLLTPHFYQVHLGKIIVRSKRKDQQFGLDNGLRNVALNVLRGTSWEKFVKRLGASAANEERNLEDLKGQDLHDYAFKLMEVLHEQRRYQEMLCVCCYAFLQTKINAASRTFQHLILYSAIRAPSWTLAFEYLRWFHQSVLVSPNFMPQNRGLLFTRLFNALNYVFCYSQNVCYHRYIMRALVRTPGCNPLRMISGNNSLITGSYRHALGEYLKVWLVSKNNTDPMVYMLIGLTFIHISCKKDISSRHMVALRGLAFMRNYEKLRGDCQETTYNIARMFHQMGMTSIAIHLYEKLLNESEAPQVWVVDEETGERKAEVMERYDLKPLAAHNLALIYESSGNLGAARAVLEKYCVI
ncbi:hypothetical protein L596_019392 [Steinernema carpocapsae]|uniref:General transcription factor 3C polypeptide 3 n=1 Tax=Steinernema carpocapsae TaxID=34508 RepID=A0A4U5MQD1_STECR|nr:hypothetical protein L596_019392 [Steinernema carpocapsae]